jgi:hypothetical protein
MARLRNMLLAGIAAIGIGLAGTAAAQNVNVMTVPVPGGGMAQIHYVGDVPPRVVFMPAPAARDAWVPVSAGFGYASPFAMFDRIAAEMDRRMAAMFRYAEAIADRATAGGLVETAHGAPPAGQSYSYVATISGNGVCTQSVRIVSRGDGTPPLVERHSSGNCGAWAAPPPGRSNVRPAAPVPAPAPRQPDLILTQHDGSSSHAGVVRQVASVR